MCISWVYNNYITIVIIYAYGVIIIHAKLEVTLSYYLTKVVSLLSAQI